MNRLFKTQLIPILAGAALISLPTASLAAFNSGSICGTAPGDTLCRGDYTAAVGNTDIQLPPDGILQYVNFTVPAGQTVTFKKNAANTPVTILASGSVTIAGVINVSALTAPTNVGTAGDGVLGDDGKAGTGGPGGFDGGAGGMGPILSGTSGAAGGGGFGPGGGQPGNGYYAPWAAGYGGSGGAFSTAGANAGYNSSSGGTAYGQATLLPLIGGSGGGGGAAGPTYSGAGGAGGGGAILIASSGTINITGTIYANGGAGGVSAGTNCGGGGGGGAGGGIRLVAEALTRSGGGGLQALGGGGGSACSYSGGAGGNGYIRLESNTITGWTTGNSNPAYTTSLPGKLFVPNSPTLAITSVNSIAVPANPTGVADITLPTGTGAVPVVVTASNVPVGTQVRIYLVQTNGVRSEVSPVPALQNDNTATASVTFSPGNTTLLASATYTVTELIAMNMPKFNGEYVAKIRVETEMGGASKTIYITASGKEYPAMAAQQKKATT